MSGIEIDSWRSQQQRVSMRRVSVAGLGLLIGLISVAMPVAAQRTERRDWWGRSVPTEPPRTYPERASTDIDDREASKLYADAQSSMDQGQHLEAQRKLEILVARFPASPLVTIARRDLAKLYVIVTLPAPKLGLESAVAPVSTQIPPTVRRPDARNLPTVSAANPAPLRLPNEEFRTQAGDRVFFSEGSADLGGRARTALEAQAAWLMRYARVQIVLEGHADERGTRDFNKQVAAKRAEVVKDRLIELGVAADRIKTVAYGRERPIADCTEQSCAQQNRLVVTVVSAIPSFGDSGGEQAARSN
jgi:peptidoglycan-associated lipoprotein